MTAPEHGPQPGVVYTPEETAERFLRTMKASALRRQATLRNIPCTKVGREIGFTAEDIAEIIAAARRSANRPVPASGGSRSARPKRRRNATSQPVAGLPIQPDPTAARKLQALT